MIEHADHFHGSDLEKIEQIFHIKKEDIVSFSANVNPLGLSEKLRKELSAHLDAITSYPDREYKKLRTTIATYCDTNPDRVIVGNGSTELISLIIKSIQPQKAMILGPTYSEYEHEITLAGGSTLYFPLREEDNFAFNVDRLAASLSENIDLLALCNPNNPTSGAITRKDLRKICDLCKQYDIFIMVDETYIEFAENMEELTSIPLTSYYNNIAILRGISKFFASPGLRLGYAITGNEALIRKVNDCQNAWSINSLAEVAGELMFTDEEYIAKTKQLIFSERDRIIKRLQAIDGLTCFPASANFILVRIDKENMNADILFEKAISQHMMIRNCSTFPFLSNRFFRFCFMNPEDNDRLLACIEDAMR